MTLLETSLLVDDEGEYRSSMRTGQPKFIHVHPEEWSDFLDQEIDKEEGEGFFLWCVVEDRDHNLKLFTVIYQRNYGLQGFIADEDMVEFKTIDTDLVLPNFKASELFSADDINITIH